jgi:flavin-dependent dehydrogenase
MDPVEAAFDVIIVGGGPAGLSVGAELAQKGQKVLLLEKGKIGETDRAWIVPGSIIAKLDQDVQKFAYNGVTRFLEFTPGLEICWEAVAPWDSAAKWRKYPYIRQREILRYWAELILDHGSQTLEHCAYVDHERVGETIAVTTWDGNGYKKFKARLLIDASGYNSAVARKCEVSREGYFWWSVYGYEMEFADIEQLENPGDLGRMKVGDYMLWQSFSDIPEDKEATLTQMRPILEYEVLDGKTVFVFILYFCKKTLEKAYMKRQLDDILQNQASVKAFKAGKKERERFGWYPSSGLSQKIALDRIAFIGDAGCWTIPAGWGMSFILNNYRIYAENIKNALLQDELDGESLNKAVCFNEKKKYEIVMDKVVLHFLASASPSLIDRFTRCVINAFGGGKLEMMFCLEMSEHDAIVLLKVILQEFSPHELFSVIKKEQDYLLLLEVAKDFAETAIIDGFKKFFGKRQEEAGFEFQRED